MIAHVISQHWSGPIVLLSYLIAVTGSYCTIQLMEQWRIVDDKRHKLWMLVLSSIALGGCGIWCMHFTGMNALHMILDDGSVLEVHFEGGLTIGSLIFPIAGVFMGLKISSEDPFFLEIEASRRKEILTKDLKHMSMQVVVKKDAIGRRIKFLALFSRLWRIGFGGFFAALGVLGMHYLGMMAQRTNASMQLDAGIVALSSGVAFFTANAAFWILFRALTFWPKYESLRIGSALIMGIAVCGTHYIGMGAASYEYTEENYAVTTYLLFDGTIAATIASHGSLLLCYWLSTFAVVKNLRESALNSKSSTVVPVTHTTRSPSQSPRIATAKHMMQSGISIHEDASTRSNNTNQGAGVVGHVGPMTSVVPFSPMH